MHFLHFQVLITILYLPWLHGMVVLFYLINFLLLDFIIHRFGWSGCSYTVLNDAAM